MNTVLVTAYDINPYKGSESSTGWNFTLQLAQFNSVVAVTRKNNQKHIERFIEEFDVDTSNLSFKYYDFPYYLRFWKRGAKGSSLYFYLWQMFMPVFVRRCQIEFDIAHNVNFHADAFPTFLWLLGKPTMWGPINHNEKIPKSYLNNKKDYIKDRIKWGIKNINWNIDPFMYLAKKKVDLVIGGNSSVQKRLGIENNRFIKLSQVASSRVMIKERHGSLFNILIVGRFITIKSLDLALYAFEEMYKELPIEDQENIRLSIIGDGPLNVSLKELVISFESRNAIEFLGWIDKSSMDAYYRDASVFLFTSHEGAGMVVVEALSFGLPIICFDNFGAGEFVDDTCALKIPYTNFDQSKIDFKEALLRLYKDEELSKALSVSGKKLFDQKFTWESKGLVLEDIYTKLVKKS